MKRTNATEVAACPDVIGQLVMRHGGIRVLAARAGLSGETIRRLMIGEANPSYQTALAIDAAFGTELRHSAISQRARGKALYETPLGTAVISLARVKRISVSSLLQSASLTYADLVSVAFGRPSKEPARRRRQSGFASLGIDINTFASSTRTDHADQ